MKPILELKKVNYSFGSTKVLSDISFSVMKGDFLGLVGQNGSGKTTLLKLLLNLYKCKKGAISLFGEKKEIFDDWYKIGYIPQKATNFSQDFPATVFEIVATGLLSKKSFPKRFSVEDKTAVLAVLTKVNMQEFIKRRIGELSGGQQQRVFIARALITNPELLILDEPTTGVDQQTQNSFYDLLGQLHKSGVTIILVSHDIDRITHYVTKIARLNQHLDFYGTHDEFCKHPHEDNDHHCLDLGGHKC